MEAVFYQIKKYHHMEKKSTRFREKTRKKKAGEDEFVGFRESESKDSDVISS